MAKANGKKIIKKTGLIMAVILAVTGVASLLAWGTFGYTDWTFGNWRSAAPEELPAAPAEELTDEEPQSYAFAVPARTVAASSRAVPDGAEAEYENFISSGTDKTADDYLAKVTVKNNIDGQTVSAKEANIKFAWVTLIMSQTGWFVPRVNPFEHLTSAGYIYKDMTCKYRGVDKQCMHSTQFEYWNPYYESGKATAADLGAIEITYILEQDPNAVKPLPPAPQKEGYTFTGWYYGTDEEHGENCTKYIGETVTSNINLHAHFEINRFTVTFDTDGGNNIENQVVDWNSSITPPTPDKRGYMFKGWFLEDGTEYTGQAIKQDTTLKAHWEIKTFTVTFYVGGEVYATKEVDYGTTFAEMAEEAKDLNLRVLSVMTEHGEQPIEYFADNRITDDYSVVSDKLSAREIAVNTLQKYPWIIFAGGGALSVLVGIVGVVASIVQTRKPARRRRR